MKAIRKHAQLPAIRGVCSGNAPGRVGIVIVAFAAMAGTASAQRTLTAAAEGRNAPGGAAVISIRPGTKVAVVSTKAPNVLVTVEGWVDASRLAGKLDEFPASVDAKSPLRVRGGASATASVLAELRPRTGVYPLAKSGTWTRIKRSVWIPESALAKAASVAAAKPPAVRAPAAGAPRKEAAAAPAPAQGDDAQAGPAAPQLPAGSMRMARNSKLLSAPGTSAVGEVTGGTVVQALAHDHGFAKVRVEGWVPDRDLEPADSSMGAQLTAADLRADPEGTRGKSVQWEVEVLSLQIADPLRPELARDEPYLLAKGPGAENALLYLAVPPSLLVQAKALPPLTRVLITARVRVGHSAPVGTPILDLKSISRR